MFVYMVCGHASVYFGGISVYKVQILFATYLCIGLCICMFPLSSVGDIM